MKSNKVYERAIALLNEMLDLMEQIENAPPRLFPDYLPGKERRLLKRRADRLRSGEARPAAENLFSGPKLARLFEDTIAANELREKTGPAFHRNFSEMGRLTHEDGPAAKQAIDDFFLDAQAQAEEQGPGSVADRRWRHLQFFVDFTKTARTDSRRDRPAKSRGQMPQQERKALVPLVPAELITSAEPDETVIPIPADGDLSDRLLMRIGDKGRSWIGSFERGTKLVSTCYMLPDRKHLFVSADGAGYIIDAKSRTLVERSGTGVVGTMCDELLTLFVVIHDSVVFEAFGADGRLWKTEPVGAGGLRKVVLTDDGIAGEARQASGAWTKFSVKLATGEVSVGLIAVAPLILPHEHEIARALVIPKDDGI